MSYFDTFLILKTIFIIFETKILQMQSLQRCPWPSNNKLMLDYHDTEWGVPLHDDRKLFEFMLLDTFQAGLSWQIVLNKREGFRKAFCQFDPKKIAIFDEEDILSLMGNAEIIRNKAKIRATIGNAKAFNKLATEFGSFDSYIWQFTKGKTINNHLSTLSEMPINSKESDAMSKSLISNGFKFVGSTICYAFMQAAGMVNDHLIDCFRHEGH